MKQIRLTLIGACAVMALLTSCGKGNGNGTPTPPPNTVTPCRLSEEASSGGAGYQGDWVYEYDDKGSIKRAYVQANHAPTGQQVTVSGGLVDIIRSPDFTEELGYAGLDATFTPTSLHVSLYDKPTTYPNWDAYTMKYNTDGKLANFTNSAASVSIFYDAKGNVTKITAYLFTGPRVEVNVLTTVEGYDDKPSPYTGVPMFKFLQHNFSWAYYDDPQFIAMLSTNNPGKITTSNYDSGTNKYVISTIRQMTYDYYDTGMPFHCNATDITSGTGKPFSSRTYVYTGCK